MPKELMQAKADLRAHNKALAAGAATGVMEPEQVRDDVEATIADFAKQVTDIRLGKVVDKNGRKIAPRQISLVQAINQYYGISAPKQDMFGKPLSPKEQSMFILKTFFRQQEIYFGEDTLYTAAQRFGCDHLTIGSLVGAMLQHSEIGFDSPANTGDITADWRFILPELILAAIRVEYDATTYNQNWIATTINITQKDIKMPQIRRGNTIAKKVNEGESIGFGVVSFGQKSAEVFKVGLGFEITDELMERSTLDMMFLFLGEVGMDMGISADVEAMNVLVNGEQGNGSESAPVIGVDTVLNGFQYVDIKRGTSRLQRLRRNVTRIITSENDGLLITGLNRFEGFDGPTRLSNIQSILGVPETLQHDVYNMPSNQIMLLAPDQAMAKLQYRSMKVERDRNIQNQTNRLFVSDYVGFTIIRRDARLIIDKSVAFGVQGFPAYMDIDSRINQAFKYQNEL